MKRRAVLAGLAVASAALGAGASTLLFRRPNAGELAGGRSAPPLGERSIYALGSRWTSDEGKPVRLAELAGSVQLLAMMFTSCPSVCPTFVRELALLDRRLPKTLRDRTHVTLVSIDPERDTPAALSRYREKMGLERGRFTLLRGEPADVRELAQVVGVAYAKTEGSDIAHTRLVTVLDASGEVVHQQTGVSEDSERLIAGLERAGGITRG
jgi:protein SCO1